MPIEIRQARVTDLDAVARLFDDYRRFYHAASNLALATAFIGERLRGQDSVILMARDGDGVALGFTQLFPSFSSVGCTRIFVLNDVSVRRHHLDGAEEAGQHVCWPVAGGRATRRGALRTVP